MRVYEKKRIVNIAAKELSVSLTLLLFTLCGFVFACYVWGNDSSLSNKGLIINQTQVVTAASFYTSFMQNLLLNAVYAIIFAVLSCFSFGFLLIPFLLSFKAMGSGFVICCVISQYMTARQWGSVAVSLTDLLNLAALFLIAVLCCRCSMNLLNGGLRKSEKKDLSSRVITAVISVVLILISAALKTAALHFSSGG